MTGLEAVARGPWGSCSAPVLVAGAVLARGRSVLARSSARRARSGGDAGLAWEIRLSSTRKSAPIAPSVRSSRAAARSWRSRRATCGQSWASSLRDVGASLDQNLARSRETLDAAGLPRGRMQDDNQKKLEEMRADRGREAAGTLERASAESSSWSAERLEAVHKGLGEMQTLATGVGDLKRVLTNVRPAASGARCSWGAARTDSGPDQYARQRRDAPGRASGSSSRSGCRAATTARSPSGCRSTRSSRTRTTSACWPRRKRRRGGGRGGRARAGGAHRRGASEIRDKYMYPPHTTDFALLFLPTEGLTPR